jgi:hypothetical protein
LTITANEQSMIYGDSFPSLTVSYAGFVNGDTSASLTTLPTISTPATPTSHVASYTITASGATDPNYSINYVPGMLTITPASLTITADNQTKVYGDPLPTLTASYSGFVNGDTSASLTVMPTVTTTATASSDVVPGGYPITADGAVDPNYTITYFAGTLTITPANQTITWNNPGDIIYGTALSSSQLNAAVSVVGPAPAGTLTYNPAAGTILGPGSGQILSVTAAATNDYNSATLTVSINVVYNFSGFLPPLKKATSFGLGRTIPIKFQLSDVNGNLITTLAAVSSLQGQALDANGKPVGSPFAPSSSGNSGLRNDGTQYIFNWQTKGLAAGSYEILLSLNDGTTKTRTLQLTKTSGSAGMTTVSAGGIGSNSGGQLLAGDLELYVNDPNGLFTADELARIEDVIASLDGLVSPYGVTIAEVNDSSVANVTLDTGGTSAVGGYADGVLGCETDSGEITIIQGWNWYAGSDPTGIAPGQYDFQTVVTHELGHALGLGHSANAASVMYATLTTGTAIRALTVADLNVPDSDAGGACGLHADPAPGAEIYFDGLYPSRPFPTQGEGERWDLTPLSPMQAALSAVLADWTFQHDFATRIANLLGIGTGTSFANRLNGNYFLQPGVTVFDDGVQDQLTGSAGQDWFFANIFGPGVLDKIVCVPVRPY